MKLFPLCRQASGLLNLIYTPEGCGLPGCLLLGRRFPVMARPSRIRKALRESGECPTVTIPAKRPEPYGIPTPTSLEITEFSAPVTSIVSAARRPIDLVLRDRCP